MRRAIVLTLVLLGSALAQTFPKEAEQRFELAKELMQKGKYAEAAKTYREVADWPGPATFPERAQALYMAGLMHQNDRQLERAVAAWRELEKRFPDSRFAALARKEVSELEAAGGGLEFRRRLDACWDVLLPALEKRDRPELARAASLLEKLLADFPEHPRAQDVAIAIAEARQKLDEHAAAIAALERSLELARREAKKPGADARAEGDVANAEEKLAEGRRVQLRARIDLAAKLAVVLALAVALASRPWTRATRRHLRLSLIFLGVASLLAVLATVAAELVRRYVDDHSPLEEAMAAALVLLPALAGQLVAVALGAGRGRRGAFQGAALGAVAALSVAACLVHAFGLFPFLDSNL